MESPNKCVTLRILLIISYPSIPAIPQLFNHDFFSRVNAETSCLWIKMRINALIKWFSEAADIWTYRAGFLSIHLFTSIFAHLVLSFRFPLLRSSRAPILVVAQYSKFRAVGNMLLMRCVDRYSYTWLDWANSSVWRFFNFLHPPPLRSTMISSQPSDLSSNASSKSRYHRPMNWGIQPHNLCKKKYSAARRRITPELWIVFAQTIKILNYFSFFGSSLSYSEKGPFLTFLSTGLFVRGRL